MNMCTVDWNELEAELRYLRFYHEAAKEHFEFGDDECVMAIQMDYIAQGGKYVPTKWQVMK